VAGTDTDVGKTVLSAIALRAALRSGPAGYWKPVQTWSDSDTETVRRLAGAPGSVFAEPLRHYPLPASPHEAAADVGTEVPVEQLSPRLDELRRSPEALRWIVELAGGLLVPYRMDVLQLDWLQQIRLPLLFAARSGLGTLNHTLLSSRALASVGLRPNALFLIGDRHPSNLATLIELAGADDVFEVPRFERLDGEALEGWLDEARSHRGRALPELVAEEVASTDAVR
jgi:malonyl-CoA O-methyltransferase